MIVDTTFLTVTILSDLLVNGMDMSDFMMIVAGAQIGAVSKSAMPPPEIAKAMIVDTTYLTVTILSDLLVNGMDMSAFMMIVAGAQIVLPSYEFLLA